MLPFDFFHNRVCELHILFFVKNPVWELHILAATPQSLLCSVVSMTNLVGHIIFTSFVDSHKT